MTYEETVYRYVVEYQDNLPESMKDEYRAHGIDPNERWTLEWSFKTLEEANTQKLDYELDFFPQRKYRVRDTGSEHKITREMW
jgi:hypothetical protein